MQLVDMCVYTHLFKLRIINILAPIEIRHGVRSLELNNGQLQLFVECPSSISFRQSRPFIGRSGNVIFSRTVLHLGYHENLKSAKLTLYYTALVKILGRKTERNMIAFWQSLTVSLV